MYGYAAVHDAAIQGVSTALYWAERAGIEVTLLKVGESRAAQAY